MKCKTLQGFSEMTVLLGNCYVLL